MPHKGYSSITVNDDIKERLCKIAKKTGLSIPEVISALLNHYTGEGA